VTERLWRVRRRSVRAPVSACESSGREMAALIAIGVFVAAILLLNVIEFGRPD
jgi:hypothetical protein